MLVSQHLQSLRKHAPFVILRTYVVSQGNFLEANRFFSSSVDSMEASTVSPNLTKTAVNYLLITPSIDTAIIYLACNIFDLIRS